MPQRWWHSILLYMCLSDLHKAFDLIEYPALLKRLYDLEW